MDCALKGGSPRNSVRNRLQHVCPLPAARALEPFCSSSTILSGALRYNAKICPGKKSLWEGRLGMYKDELPEPYLGMSI